MTMQHVQFTGLDRHAELLRAARPQPERPTGRPGRRVPAVSTPTLCPTC